jgi:hypothetical protein
VKPKDFVHSLGSLLDITIDTYQHIILQNIVKAKGYNFCYKVAEMAKSKLETTTSTEYIAMLKDLMAPHEWKLIRSLHKKSNASKPKPIELPINVKLLHWVADTRTNYRGSEEKKGFSRPSRGSRMHN